MGRECVLGLLLAPLTGCSWMLDFSDSAIPVDAAPDAPYTQEQCDYLEPNDSLAEAALITPAEIGTAAICAGDVEDHDFYKFTVPPDTASVTIRILFSSRPGGDLDLKLLDASGTMLAQSRGFVDDETIVCPSASPSCPALTEGDYVFEVFPAVPGSTNSYTLSLTIIPQTLPR
jgi:hypothetical protein